MQHRARPPCFGAIDLTSDVEKAFFWFRNEPIADYKRKTAVKLVVEGQAGAVLPHRDDLRDGSAGWSLRDLTSVIALLLPHHEMVVPAKNGAGATQNGGRFNRPEVEALYLSDGPETALAEYG